MESKAFPQTKKTTPGVHRSMMSMLHTSHVHKKSMERMWKTANTCKLFLKKTVKKQTLKPGEKKKKNSYRRNRVLSSHTIKALVSGAAAHASSSAYKSATALRCDVTPEYVKCPLMPTIGQAASALFEQAIVAYCQEAFLNAVNLKNAIGKHKKVTVKAQTAAVDALNERINEATCMMPTSCIPHLAPSKYASKTPSKSPKPAEASLEAPKRAAPEIVS